MNHISLKSNLASFDAVRYLTNEAAIAGYVNAALETAATDLLLRALNGIARARGMALPASA